MVINIQNTLYYGMHGFAAYEATKAVFGPDGPQKRYKELNKGNYSTALFGSDSLYMRLFYAASASIKLYALNYVSLKDLNLKDFFKKDDPSKSKLIKKGISLLKECPKAKDLFDNLQKNNPFTIGFTKSHPSAALYQDSFGSQILINPKAHFFAADTAKSILFEMLNLCQSDRFEMVRKIALEGKLSENQYAYLIESVEDNTVKLYTKVASDCIDKRHWSSYSMNAFSNNAKDKNESLHFQEKMGHTQMYRDEYRNRYKNIFCRKNKGHFSCGGMNRFPKTAEDYGKVRAGIRQEIFDRIKKEPICKV